MRGYRLVNPIGSRRMGNRQGDLPPLQAQEPTVCEPAKLASPSTSAEAASPDSPKIEAPAVMPPPAPETQLEPQLESVAAAATAEAAPIVVSTEPTKPEAVIVDPLKLEDVRPADARSGETVAPDTAPSLLSAWT